MGAPDASVIVPAYKKRKALELTLAGFARQTHPAERFEVIVVDDGSEDGTEALVRGFEALCPIRYVGQPNSGRSAARNAGIRVARGPILIFNDADSIPCPEFIAEHLRGHGGGERAVVNGARNHVLACWLPELPPELLDSISHHAAERGPEVAESIRRARELGAEIELLTRADVERDFAKVEQYSARAGHDFDALYALHPDDLEGYAAPWITFITQNVSVHRAMLAQTGPFDESFRGWGYEDVELGFRLHRAGARFRHAERAANFQQIHPGGLTGSLQSWRELAGNYARFLEKHPCLEVSLHWRVIHGLLSPQALGRVVDEHRRLSSGGGDGVAADYLALCEQLAREYCRAEDPSPLGVARSPLLAACALGRS